MWLSSGSQEPKKPKEELSARRELNMAKRCQLLTGSFEGNIESCPCDNLEACHIPEERMGILIDTPEIKNKRDKNMDCYRKASELIDEVTNDSGRR